MEKSFRQFIEWTIQHKKQLEMHMHLVAVLTNFSCLSNNLNVYVSLVAAIQCIWSFRFGFESEIPSIYIFLSTRRRASADSIWSDNRWPAQTE